MVAILIITWAEGAGVGDYSSKVRGGGGEENCGTVITSFTELVVPRWQPVRRAISRRSHGKIGDCEQSKYFISRTNSQRSPVTRHLRVQQKGHASPIVSTRNCVWFAKKSVNAKLFLVRTIFCLHQNFCKRNETSQIPSTNFGGWKNFVRRENPLFLDIHPSLRH